jgi:hypothetical protein
MLNVPHHDKCGNVQQCQPGANKERTYDNLRGALAECKRDHGDKQSQPYGVVHQNFPRRSAMAV